MRTIAPSSCPDRGKPLTYFDPVESSWLKSRYRVVLLLMSLAYPDCHRRLARVGLWTCSAMLIVAGLCSNVLPSRSKPQRLWSRLVRLSSTLKNSYPLLFCGRLGKVLLQEEHIYSFHNPAIMTFCHALVGTRFASSRVSSLTLGRCFVSSSSISLWFAVGSPGHVSKTYPVLSCSAGRASRTDRSFVTRLGDNHHRLTQRE